MPEWLIGGLTVLASASVPSVIVFFLSRIKTEALGERAGLPLLNLEIFDLVRATKKSRGGCK